LAAIALEIFLIPNNIIDGGIVGISIITSYLTKLPLSLFIIVFNILFLFLGYKHIGKTFVFSSLFSIISLSWWLSVFHPIPGLTNDVLLAAVFGGIVLGVGVGMIIRGGFTKNKKTILYSVVTRLEVAKLKSIIFDKDDTAFVTINDVSDVMGGKHRKRSIH